MPFRSKRNGNILFFIFGAIALSGLAGLALSNVVKGPLKSAVQLTRINTAENQMALHAKSLVMAASSLANQGDCDGDGLIEPWEWRVAGSLPGPTGGGLIPNNIIQSTKDPWGNEYGYCVWDHGTSVLNASCQSTGVNARLSGADTRAATVVAIISAGPDKKFTTTCRNFASGSGRADQNNNGLLGDTGDYPLISKNANSDDDIILSYTYEEAASISGGLWKLKPADPATAIIAKNIDVVGDVSSSETGLFHKIGKTVSVAAPADCAGLGGAYYNDPVSGHCYYRGSGSLGWEAAKAACLSKGAYLATITSATEQALIETQLVPTGNTWIGGNALSVAGEWRWSGGPESNVQFWQGTSAGNSVGGMYANWASGEPSANNTCVVIDTSKSNKWRAAGGCTSGISYFCEKTGTVGSLSNVLEIDAGIKLASPTEMPLCNTTNKGSARNNSSGNGIEICDGVSWKGLGGADSGTTFPLLAPNGTESNPSYSFTASQGTGLYLGSGNLNVKSVGVVDVTSGGQVNMSGATNNFRIASSGGVKIGHDAGSCNALIQGTLRYSSGTKKFEFCDGTEWSIFGGKAVSGGSIENCTGLGVAHYNDEPSGHCYFKLNATLSWNDAQASCQAQGGYLAAVTSAEEMALILDKFYPRANAPEYFYLGGSDAEVEGQWKWMGGEADGTLFWHGAADGSAMNGLYNAWMPMFTPMVSNENSDCLTVATTDQQDMPQIWLDSPCTQSDPILSSLCEKGN